MKLSRAQVGGLLGFSKETISMYARYSPQLLPPFTVDENGRTVFEIDDVIAFMRERDAILQYGMTTKEAAAYLGLGQNKFTKLFSHCGWKPKPHKVGNKVYYFPQQLDMWAERVGMKKVYVPEVYIPAHYEWERPKEWNVREGYVRDER